MPVKCRAWPGKTYIPQIALVRRRIWANTGHLRNIWHRSACEELYQFLYMLWTGLSEFSMDANVYCCRSQVHWCRSMCFTIHLIACHSISKESPQGLWMKTWKITVHSWEYYGSVRGVSKNLRKICHNDHTGVRQFCIIWIIMGLGTLCRLLLTVSTRAAAFDTCLCSQPLRKWELCKDRPIAYMQLRIVMSTMSVMTLQWRWYDVASTPWLWNQLQEHLTFQTPKLMYWAVSSSS